jgi:hypothetical protein
MAGPKYGKKPGHEVRVVREQESDPRLRIMREDGGLILDLLKKLAVGKSPLAIVHRDSLRVGLGASTEKGC